MLTRRQALALIGRVSAASALLPMHVTRQAMATTRPERRLIVMILRGGLDGLAAVPPYADPDYALRRPQLVTSSDDAAPVVLELDGQFGLHAALAPLKAWYDAGEMLVVHAIGTPSPLPSHIAAQNWLESGYAPTDVQDGWLNRALSGLPTDAPLGLAIGPAVPLIFRGQVPIHVFNPPRLPKIDADVLQRLEVLYAHDPLLQPAFKRVSPVINEEVGLRWRWDPSVRRPTLRVYCDAVGKALAKPDGPRVAVLDAHGWDTHAQQATQLPDLLTQLVNGLDSLKASLAPVWRHTLVLVVTEFGRTVEINAVAGTDHGAASIALALGGAVAGGRVTGTWPGLKRSGRMASLALHPTTDLRSLFKAALHQHLGLAESFIEDHVFPNSRTIPPLTGLMRPT